MPSELREMLNEVGWTLFAVWIIGLGLCIWLSYRDESLPLERPSRVLAAVGLGGSPVVAIFLKYFSSGMPLAFYMVFGLIPSVMIIATGGRPALIACLERRYRVKLDAGERRRAYVGMVAYLAAVFAASASMMLFDL